MILFHFRIRSLNFPSRAFPNYILSLQIIFTLVQAGADHYCVLVSLSPKLGQWRCLYTRLASSCQPHWVTYFHSKAKPVIWAEMETYWCKWRKWNWNKATWRMWMSHTAVCLHSLPAKRLLYTQIRLLENIQHRSSCLYSISQRTTPFVAKSPVSNTALVITLLSVWFILCKQHG